MNNIQNEIVKEQLMLLVDSMMNRKPVVVRGKTIGVDSHADTIIDVVNGIECEDGRGMLYNIMFATQGKMHVDLNRAYIIHASMFTIKA